MFLSRRPHVRSIECEELVANCIESGWISSEGPAVKDFEAKMASRCSRRHAVACANGSAALDIAVKALRLGEGDEAPWGSGSDRLVTPLGSS